MESKHIQSMIAINANRITDKHARVAAIQAETRQFKAVMPVVSPLFKDHVETMLKRAYSIIDKTRDELKKAVEMQKALQAELRANRAAEKAAKPVAQTKSRFFTSEDWYGDAFCVEVKPSGERIVYREDGTTRECNPYFDHAYQVDIGMCVEHTERQFPAQAPGEYNILHDGQPKKNGEYNVKYSSDDTPNTVRYFEDGVWYTRQNGGKLGFGNYAQDFEHEYYIVK